MRVVGLISGGKDSCYNLMQCVAEGHEIVALANLRPRDKDELDSYMYQTVGHHAIDLYAEAIGLPLYRRTISGTALDISRDYVQTSDDEVEDLLLLLQQIKDDGIEFDAVSVGAILSDYQRVRVENVCSRLGLTSLAYLWRRDQKQLLTEMIGAGVKAVLIKVAALGLTPEKHLGKSLEEIYDHMLLMSERFGLNVCGEGGEYETFTLDCPLFLKHIVLDEVEVVMHSDDAFAPVAYLNLRQMHLVDKNNAQLSMRDRLRDVKMKQANDLRCELFPDGFDPIVPAECTAVEIFDPCDQPAVKTNHNWIHTEPVVSCCNSSGLLWVTGVVASGHSIEGIRQALDSLAGSLSMVSCRLSDIVAVYLFVSDMSKFSTINDVYKNYFPTLPPVRVCVEACLPSSVLFQLDCIAFRPQETAYSSSSSDDIELRRMHVQSLSFWAPANIGPYSQAVQVGRRLYIAGQIALCPSTMTLVEGGPVVESRLVLRHVSRVLDAMCSGVRLCDVINAVCYVTSQEAGLAAQREWNRSLIETSSGDDNDEMDHIHQPRVQYVVVPALPRQAAVEWQVTAGSQAKDWIEESSRQSNSEFTVQSQFSRTADQKDLLSFLVSVDVRPRGSATDSSLKSLPDAVRSALSALNTSVSATGSSLSDIGALRLFVALRHFISSDVYQDCQSAAKSVFGDDITFPFTIVPVCRFLSPLTVLTVCQA